MKKIPFFLLLLGLLCATTAVAQVPELEYESPPNRRLAFSDVLVSSLRERFDLTGDGIPELPLLHEDDQGNPDTFFAFDPTTHEAAFSLNFEEIKIALDGQHPTRFLGFFSFYDDENKAAVFRGENQLGIIAILIGKQGAATSATLPAEQALLLDIDDDGLVEAIVRNPETGTVQIWGTGNTGTATEREIEAALARLFQNYPNPFREATTIAYEVEQPGPVTITVYDVLGRRVATLVDQDQTPGTYHVDWNGRDGAGQPVASGAYFYQLRVGQMVSSRQALRIQ